MSRIDGLLASIITEAWSRGNWSHIDIGHTYAQHAAITEPWNAALKAMKAYVQNNFHITKKGVWHCSQCRGSSDDFHSWHIPGKCHVATQQAAIAAMEGDLTPDENVVESET